MRNTTIHLLNCYMLDINHNHTVNFKNETNQLNWFFNRKIYSQYDVMYHKKDNNINVSFPLHQLENVNYILIKNDNEKWLYYFILDKIYLNDNTTKLILKLDVIQTYYFQINFNKFTSLIDRQHCQLWLENLPFTSSMQGVENLEIGEYVEKSRTTVFDYANSGGFIVTSSDKLSAKNGGSSGGGEDGGSGGSSGDWKNGIISSNGFRFVKGYEAYAPYEYQDSGGYWTIAYGVTKHGELDIYNQLAKLQPVPEQKCAEVSYKLKNDRYGKKILNACKNVLGVKKQNEFDALLSLAYNCGTGVITGDNSLTRAIKSGSSSNIRTAWEKFYISDGNNELEGLKLRRKAECNIFLNNDYEFRKIPKLNKNGNIDGYVTENDGNGWLPTDKVVEDNNIVNSARKLIGLPYVWGGNYPPLGNDKGVDCSSLCQWAYNDNGIKISRTTYTQIKEGKEINISDVKKGDLVFSRFSSPTSPEHVYIYSGNIDGKHMCIEAPRTGLNVREIEFKFGSDFRVRRLL